MCNCAVCMELRALGAIRESLPNEHDRDYFENFIDKYLCVSMDNDIAEFNLEEYRGYVQKFLGDEQYEFFKKWVRKEKGIQ